MIFLIFFGLSVFVSYGLFLYTVTKDPGYIKINISENKNEDLKNLILLLSNNDAALLCFDCNIIKPKRSRHC